MFHFRLIMTADGNQIIDLSKNTPYDSITPMEMLEYIEVDEKLAFSERLERRRQRLEEPPQRFLMNPFRRLICALS